MATFTDTFTDTAGTALTAHTPDSGGSWTEDADTTVGRQLNIASVGGQSVAQLNNGSSSSRVVYSVSWTLASAEYDVSITIGSASSIPAGSDDPVAALGRITTGNTFYAGCTLQSGAAADKVLAQFNGGSVTVLASGDNGFAVGDVLTLKVRNATKKLFHNGAEVLSSTDNDLTSTGKAGIGIGNVSGTSSDDPSLWAIDSFEVVEAGGGGFIPFPHPRGLYGGAHMLSGGMQ